MDVRSVRFHDLLVLHRFETQRGAHIVWPLSLDAPASTGRVAFASAWQDVNPSCCTFVLFEKREVIGLIQATARAGQDSWDLLRLAVLSADAEDRERAVDALVEPALMAAASRGALRTFARVRTDGDAPSTLMRAGFRQYTTEFTLIHDNLDLAPAPLPPHLECRPRQPSDAWGIFQLYCSIAPPSVRHAEGLSSKRWTYESRLAYALSHQWRPVREIILADEGRIVGWVRRRAVRGFEARRIDLMLHPRAGIDVGALLSHAAVALGFHGNDRTICRVRLYEVDVKAALLDLGFTTVAEEALFVKHAAARVTERQLLIAALRAQGLGLDVSHSHAVDGALRARMPLSAREHCPHD